MPLPPDHPQRAQLNDEVHARPYVPITAPARATYFAVLRDESDPGADQRALQALCEALGVQSPAPDAVHFSGDLGPVHLKWARHSEFTSYMLICRGEVDDPFVQTPLAVLPQGWLERVPGRVITASHAAVLAAGDSPPPVSQIAQRYFGGNTLIGSRIGGAAQALTDFRLQADGCIRFVIVDSGMGTRQAGRMLQRLFEIDVYRMAALLTFPIARSLMPSLGDADRQLVAITGAIAEARAADEPRLLEELTRLAASVETSLSATQYRFSAAAAYHELVERRIAELREGRIEGIQTFQEFMERRLLPAMNTCRSVAQRQEMLSKRVARAAQLLGTRVDITREAQNQQILASMNRRAKLQLRLQETVEGLSVAAITYYTVGLVGYLAKGMKAAGAPVNPDLAVALAIPVVAIAAALGIRHIRHAVSKEMNAFLGRQ